MKNVKAAAIAVSILTVGTGAFALGFGSIGNDAASERSTASAPTRATDDGHDDASPTTTAIDGKSDGSSSRGDAVAPVHDELSADTGPASPDGPLDPIGGITPGLVPAGLDLTTFPGAPEGGANPLSASDDLSAGPGCAYQCISSGVAYPRGFGAELLVTTKVPADVFMTVVADTDGNGTYDVSEEAWSPGKVSDFSWSLDHLRPGQLHYAMVVATDEHGDTSYAWGEFTTLATRSVEIAVDHLAVFDGPTNVVDTSLFVRHDDDDHATYELGDWIGWDHAARDVDLDVLVARTWEADVCEPFWPSLMESPQGDSDDSCLSWNTATAAIDLDQLPSGDGPWADHTFEVELRTPNGAGNALPDGYGDPRWFHVVATGQVHVSYR